MSSPLVSVIINCHNGGVFLCDCIESVMTQNYQNWEIIFWDNASSDNTKKLVNQYLANPQFHYFHSSIFEPLGKARNYALAKTRGKYIAFLDIDDRWIPSKLSIQVALMENHPETIVTYSDAIIIVNKIHNKLTYKQSGFYRNKMYSGFIYEKLIRQNFVNWASVVINKKLAHNELHFNNSFSYIEDLELLLRLSRLGPFKYIDIPLVCYNVHPQSLSNLKLSIQYIEYRELYSLIRSHKTISTFTAWRYINGNISLKKCKESIYEQKYFMTFSYSIIALLIIPEIVLWKLVNKIQRLFIITCK